MADQCTKKRCYISSSSVSCIFFSCCIKETFYIKNFTQFLYLLHINKSNACICFLLKAMNEIFIFIQ